MNNKDQIVDNIEKIDLKYLEEYYDRRCRRQSIRKNITRSCGIVACVVLATVISIVTILPMKTNAPSVTPSDTLQGTQSTTSAMIEKMDIVFSNNISSVQAENDVVSDRLYDPDSAESLFFNFILSDAIENADDDTIFAFTVTVIDGQTADSFPEIVNLLEDSETVLLEKAVECVNQLMQERGISREEAEARKFSHPMFISARENFQNVKSQYVSAWVTSFFENNQTAYEEFSALGFTELYNSLNEEYQPYLYRMGALGVMYGTKAQLMELKDKELANKYFLQAAYENASDIAVDDFYTGSEINLSDDSKLTDELIDEYEKANGGKLRVLCQIAYFGKVYFENGYDSREELIRDTLEIMGMTQEEFNNCNDSEIIDKYIEIKHRLLNHADYNEETVEKLLYDGEFIEIQNYRAAFIAELTYERAIELSKNKEIAYIEVIEETTDGEYLFQNEILAELE